MVEKFWALLKTLKKHDTRFNDLVVRWTKPDYRLLCLVIMSIAGIVN